MSDERFACKPFTNAPKAGALAIQASLRRANTAVGQNNIAAMLERSPAWMSQFFSGQGTVDACLNFDGICRFLDALGVSVGDKSGEQVFIDEISALALQTAMAHIGQCQEGDSPETELMRKLADYGYKAMMANAMRVGREET